MATIRFQMQMDSSLGSESFSLVSRKWEGRAILRQSLHRPSSIPCTFDSMGGHPSAILSADGPRKKKKRWSLKDVLESVTRMIG